jgi:hypothetical protein
MPKLVPLKEWICDRCGEITGIDDGWLEWLDDPPGAREFRIVHRVARCRNHTYRRGGSDKNLRAFLGADGLQDMLSWLDIGPLLAPQEPSTSRVADIRNYVDTLRRLQIPYYEEARRYFGEALSDGYFSDHNEVSIFLPETCVAIIEHYEQS